MSLVLAILALSLLVIVHEGGHFLVARWSKMRVERFSLGFGPALLKWRAGGTQIQIAPILIGGFVHIVGMNPHEEFDENDPHVYPNRPTWQRFLTIAAGPVTNLLLAVVLIFSVYACAGMETAWYRVDEIKPDQPAAGLLQPGDRILAIDGLPVSFSPRGFRDRVQSKGGAPVAVTVLRAGKELTVNITPKKDESGQYMVGIALGADIERHRVGLGTAAWESIKYPVVKSIAMVTDIVETIRHRESLEASSVVKITVIIRQQIRAGWVAAFEFLAILSVYLGLFNLLPFPALDGGRLAFLGYELVTRRRPNPKVEAAVHMAGFLVLIALILVVTFKDIRSLF